MRVLHPLARYPVPLLASLTYGWKAYYVYKLFFHEKLIELHQQYGPVVRVGPNHLHIWDGNAIAPIYKGGRSMGKSEFYDAFMAFNPNIFGTTNDDIHSLRRRQLSHGFSQASVVNLEPLIENELKFLQNRLRTFAQTGEIFDLKLLLSLYVFDILGSVAFGKPFGAQQRGYEEVLPAINDHLLLAGIVGELPLQNVTKTISRWSPIPWMRRLMKNRDALKKVCAECVKYKINNPTERQDLLKSLVEAVDPDTGSTLTEQEINSEAFAVLVAGSHSTSGTLTLLLWHLLQNPDTLAAVVDEIESTLPPLADDQIAYPIQGLESSLSYLMACVRENFPINPVFTMPLWRRVGRPGGLEIGKYHIPYGTNICISNYVLHHTPPSGATTITIQSIPLARRETKQRTIPLPNPLQHRPSHVYRPQPRYDKYPQDQHDSAPGIRYQTGNKAANGKSAQSWDWGDGWGIFVYGFAVNVVAYILVLQPAVLEETLALFTLL
ncbi:hypothetical protein SI65_05839 [Aspergillus cristatus]|uniref:Cytochrome P450 n=1 Tax=Aspergillus cristatus TaxID=573508 RepID=A0A1E3BE29_ASPCR|nr:hypothetical protein SI65_05839 [Aspergillus cristatus]